MRTTLPLILPLLLAACAPAERPEGTDPVQQVMEAERAFARTMADRDLTAFAAFVSEEAVFFGGGETMNGRQQVVDAWKKFFEDKDAPFSWEPKQVVVLDSGTLAHSSGPVYRPNGQCIATFNSIWRKEARGVWRVIFDKGSPNCEESPK